MADSPYIATIQAFGFNYAPRDWATCSGQMLSIAQNTALFSLLGVVYGGNGQTTFGLPDLRGRTPVGQGQGPGLNPYVMGQTGGAEFTSLTANNMPVHAHPFSATVQAYSTKANASTPATGLGLATAAGATEDGGAVTVQIYGPATGSPVDLAASSGTTGPAGASSPFSLLSPYQCVNWCIALNGVFPPRPD